MSKVKNKDTCSNLVTNFEHISHDVGKFHLLTLNMYFFALIAYYYDNFPASIYFFRISNRNNRKISEIRPKLKL